MTGGEKGNLQEARGIKETKRLTLGDCSRETITSVGTSTFEAEYEEKEETT